MELVSPSLVSIIAFLAISAGLLLTAWWIAALYAAHDRKEEKEMPEIELPGHLHEKHTGVPAALVAYFIFSAVAMAAYVIAVWVGGVSY